MKPCILRGIQTFPECRIFLLFFLYQSSNSMKKDPVKQDLFSLGLILWNLYSLFVTFNDGFSCVFFSIDQVFAFRYCDV